MIIALIFSSCATSPMGRRQLHLVPTPQMDQLGQQAFSEMKAQSKISTDAKTRKYINCVVNRLLQNLKATNVSEWETEIFVTEEPNAFALPGKRIGVQTGILKVATDQDQLAAVIGHEIGHVIAQHGNERMSQGLALQGVVAIADASLDLKGPKRDILLGALGLGAQLGVLLPYSRMHETEADLYGQTLMAEAGFDPEAAIRLWENMEKLGNSAPEFLSTHPSSRTRIHNLQNNLLTTNPIYLEAVKLKGKPKC